MTTITLNEHLEKARAAKAARYKNCDGCGRKIPVADTSKLCSKCRALAAKLMSGIFENRPNVEKQVEKPVGKVVGTNPTGAGDPANTADNSSPSSPKSLSGLSDTSRLIQEREGVLGGA